MTNALQRPIIILIYSLEECRFVTYSIIVSKLQGIEMLRSWHYESFMLSQWPSDINLVKR